MKNQVGSHAFGPAKKHHRSLILRLPRYTLWVVRIGMVVIPVIAVASAMAHLIRVVQSVRISTGDALDDGKKRLIIAAKNVFVTSDAPIGLALAGKDLMSCGSVHTAIAHSVTAGDPDVRHKVTDHFTAL